jgi:hypothetical protein
MLVIGFELFFTGIGVWTLITGQVSVFGHWVVEGVGARIIGLLLVTPVTVPFVLGFMRGLDAARRGYELKFEDFTDLSLLEIGLWVGCFALAGLVALVTARKPRVVDADEEWKKIRIGGSLETADFLREDKSLRRK